MMTPLCQKCGTRTIQGRSDVVFCPQCLQKQIRTELAGAFLLDKMKEQGWWEKQPQLTPQDRREL